MSDYLTKSHYNHKFLGSEVAPASSWPAAPTPPNRQITRPPSNFETGVALIRSASLPEATVRTKGLDRTALRGQLENHLDMYSTGQMRKLLKVAGGMALGPTSAATGVLR